MARVENFWAAKQSALKELLLTKDVADFREWPVIRATMRIGDPTWLIKELRALRGTKWCNRYEDNSMLHQAYHAWMCGEKLGRDPLQFPRILEIGGGYGAMCKLLMDMGYAGDYTIIDIPEMSRVQGYYLRDYRVSLCTNVEEVSVDPDTLVIGLWSLGEVGGKFRAPYAELVRNAGAWWMAFFRGWYGVDNVEWFEREIGGEQEAIEHLSGSFYCWGENDRNI